MELMKKNLQTFFHETIKSAEEKPAELLLSLNKKWEQFLILYPPGEIKANTMGK